MYQCRLRADHHRKVSFGVMCGERCSNYLVAMATEETRPEVRIKWGSSFNGPGYFMVLGEPGAELQKAFGDGQNLEKAILTQESVHELEAYDAAALDTAVGCRHICESGLQNPMRQTVHCRDESSYSNTQDWSKSDRVRPKSLQNPNSCDMCARGAANQFPEQLLGSLLDTSW